MSIAELNESLETTVLKEGITKLAPVDQSPAVQNSQYLQDNSTNGAAVLAVAHTSRRLGSSDTEVEETVMSLVQDHVNITPQLTVDAIKLLEELKSEHSSKFIDGCRKKLPLATVFLPKEEIARLKQQLSTNATANGTTDPGEQKHANGDALLIEPTNEQ